MPPVFLARDDLHLGDKLTALAVAPDGRRVYIGRGSSDDPARENLAVLDVDPATGAVTRRRLFRDSPDPLPPSYRVPIPRRPVATVTGIVVGARYRKLYVASTLADPLARPRRLLSVHDLDDAGDPVPGSLRSYRADVDGLANEIEVDQLVLDPVADALYCTGGKWAAVRHHRLDPSGEPVADQPGVLVVPGGSPVPSLAVNAAGTRLYLGGGGRTLRVLRVEDGVPLLEPGPPPAPLRTLASAVPEVALGGDGYLRVIATPRALLAVRSLVTLAGTTARARPVPLFVLPLDERGDVAPGVTDWQRVDGFEHVVSAYDPTGDRLWLVRETVTEAPAPAGVPAGARLVGYELTAGGAPGAEVDRYPTRWGEQGVLAATGGTGVPVLVLRRPVETPVDHAAGEQLRFRVRRVSPPPTGTVTFSGRFFGAYGAPQEPVTVAEGALSEPILLDPYLTRQPGVVAVRLRFLAAAVPGVRYEVEAHYTPAGATAPLVRTTTVRGQDALFVLPGYALLPPDARPGRFEAFDEHWKTYRKAAEAVAVREDEQPDQLVVTAMGVYGGQVSTGQLADGLAAVRALGFNALGLIWPGTPPAELAAAAAGFSPEAGRYAPPFGPFAFGYDGSLTHSGTGAVIDADFLRAWAENEAAGIRAALGVSPGRIVRWQLADEPGWYFPGVLTLFDPDSPQLPAHQTVRWTDPEQRNAAWVQRFRDYVAVHDPELLAALGTGTIPIGVSGATTPQRRRLFHWTTRFLTAEAADGLRLLHDALQTAFGAERAPDPRPEHDRLHVHVNFGDGTDGSWHKPYPNATGDKNPDSGPDAATGSYDWFSFAGSGVLPSRHAYLGDALAQRWSLYADLLRSATLPAGGGSPDFMAMIPGSSLGDIPTGAAYKVASVVGRGAKVVGLYSFGPELLFPPPNSWAENLDAYPSIADAVRLVGRADRALHAGVPEPGRVAVHLPAGSRLWDQQQGGPFYSREVLPLHAALVHDGYAVDFVDDAGLAAGVLGRRDYSVLHLLGPNLPQDAGRAVAGWVAAGGTLVALPGAGTADEFDTPSGELADLLGVSGWTGWAPVRRPAFAGATVGLGSRLTVVDRGWLAALDGPERLLRDLVAVAPLPVASELVDFPTLEPAGARVVATLAPTASPGPARPAITRRAVGAGTAYAYAFFPGWQYWCSATHSAYAKGTLDLHTDRLPRHWSDQDRLLATLPARLAGTPRSVSTDRGGVEVRRLQSDRGIAVVLANWTGAGVDRLEVTVAGIGDFRRIRSVRRGPLPNLLADADDAVVRLPLPDVDILVLEA